MPYNAWGGLARSNAGEILLERKQDEETIVQHLIYASERPPQEMKQAASFPPWGSGRFVLNPSPSPSISC